MFGKAGLLKGVLLLIFALFVTTSTASATWPSLPTDDEIDAAVEHFIQAQTFDRQRVDCAAIADSNERNHCWTMRSLSFALGPEWVYKAEIVETSTLKIHHTAQPDPLIGNAVVLLYTSQLWIDHREDGLTTKQTYGKAILEHAGDYPDSPGWQFKSSSWWTIDPADVGVEPADTSRAYRDATVEVLFRPLDARGYYGWARGFRRNLTVTAYNGEDDPTRMPFTFWVKFEDAGRPIQDAAIQFALEEDVKCLADAYAVWDTTKGEWVTHTHNFAASAVSAANAPRTDSNGVVIVRAFLDFGRMRLFNLQLPCTLRFIAYAPNIAPEDPLLKAESTVTIGAPAFIRSVFVNIVTREGAAVKDNIFGLNQLRDWVSSDGPDRFGINPTPSLEEPTQARVLSRILLDGRAFVPPTDRNDYYVALKPGVQLIVDASSQPLTVHGDSTGGMWSPRHGDGMGVVIMWLDGTTGLFVVHNRSPEFNSVLSMRFVDSWSTTAGAPSSDESRFVRFLVGQGVDWVVKGAVVGVATMAGGPVAGAWAGVIVEGLHKINDLRSLGELSNANARVIWIRSVVALTSGADGRESLYVFAGEPGVEDRAGNEIRVQPGQAIEFDLAGNVTPARDQPPSARAQALAQVLPDIDAPANDLLLSSAPDSVPGDAIPSSNRTRAAQDTDWLDEDWLALDWTTVLGAGALALLVVLSLGALARGRGRRSRTTSGQAGVYAVVPAKATAKVPSRPQQARQTQGPAHRASPPPGPALCQQCGRPLREGARFCAHCGTPRAEPTVSTSPAVALCPTCHTPLRPGVRFCGACGHQVSP